jgi:hypothetical protein
MARLEVIGNEAGSLTHLRNADRALPSGRVCQEYSLVLADGGSRVGNNLNWKEKTCASASLPITADLG